MKWFWAAVSVNREGSLAVAVHGSEQFHNLRALSGIAQGGIYFHPRDEGLSPGTPEWKMPLEGGGFGVQQL